MFGSEFCNFSFWWILPLAMIALCFFMMRRRGSSMMCGFNSRSSATHHISDTDSPLDILDKRYALGEINQEEYEERKGTLIQSK
jgi:uncharacterized membrane protein